MKELQKQRQREQLEENMQLVAERTRARRDAEDATTPSAITDPKLEQVTLPPPAPRADGDSSTPPTPPPTTPKRADTEAPRTDSLPPPPAPATRPREVEPQKKKGKKGTDEP